MRLLCKGKTIPIDALTAQMDFETNDYKKMDFYSDLLQKSISSIIETEEEKDVLSLFKSGGTSALRKHIKGVEDFKLISFIIIK